MAQRLATEYVKTCLQLSEAEISKFTQLFMEHQIVPRIMVLENGNQEVVFRDKDGGEELILSFERKLGKYISNCTCRLSQPKLANILRKAISVFKGDAVVNRIYSHYTMVYHYIQGSVVKIVEVNGSNEKVIYEYKNTLGKLEQMFLRQNVEAEIESVQLEIDKLLDQRIQNHDESDLFQIDKKLQHLNYKLFILEA
jgi:hypothetical protein